MQFSLKKKILLNTVLNTPDILNRWLPLGLIAGTIALTVCGLHVICNKVITSIGASEMRAYSTAFMSLTSSNVTASNEPARRAYTVSRQGGPLGELSLSS